MRLCRIIGLSVLVLGCTAQHSVREYAVQDPEAIATVQSSAAKPRVEQETTEQRDQRQEPAVRLVARQQPAGDCPAGAGHEVEDMRTSMYRVRSQHCIDLKPVLFKDYEAWCLQSPTCDPLSLCVYGFCSGGYSVDGDDPHWCFRPATCGQQKSGQYPTKEAQCKHLASMLGS